MKLCRDLLLPDAWSVWEKKSETPTLPLWAGPGGRISHLGDAKGWSLWKVHPILLSIICSSIMAFICLICTYIVVNWCVAFQKIEELINIYIFVVTAVCWLTCEVCDTDEIIRRSTKWKFHAYIIIAFGTSLLIGWTVLSYWLKLFLSLEYLYRNLWSCIILFLNFLVWIYWSACTVFTGFERSTDFHLQMRNASSMHTWHLAPHFWSVHILSSWLKL